MSEISAFFNGEDNKVEYDSRQMCKYSELHTIAVFANEGLTPVWQLIDALRSDYDILLPATLGDLKQQLESAEKTPDLILIHATDDWLNNLLLCQRLIQNITFHKTEVSLTFQWGQIFIASGIG